ncbi:RiPP maturation radical SAM C-methyltransferase [Rhodobacter maris]|uniref:Ribosomal peptide maturation radical SAM protein 1 n=1 Tax=Rhodobacter maris TaxID=446682 RepID=A0A285SCB3_9RHOB|nr:RiPP maturation radical SAM C-methyltransferase [Rhodobacter maris]SOC03429.1 ribosomal peptide maturation radical SAM protein 1 [Rhodobacter maris]
MTYVSPDTARPAPPEGRLDLALAVMPFGLCAIPSIGPATLKAALQARGKRARIYDFNLEYLAAIGPDLTQSWRLHDEIAYLWDFLPGEWLFSPRQSAEADIAYLEDLLRQSVVSGALIERLARLRPGAAAFADYAARRLAASGAPVVGFTTSFMQTQPSLATAAALKRLAPGVKILFGGANCFGDMGEALLEAYPQIDAVATGEAEQTLVSMVEALTSGETERVGRIPGYVTRGPAGINRRAELAAPVRMDDLPIPDFRDYFRTKADLEAMRGPLPDLPMFLPIETARGCWWGAKSHCTFCGLNADRMAFRSKSADRAVAEFEQQAQRWNLSKFFVVDNILDHGYFRSVLPRLAASERKYFVHYEIKANLRRHHFEAMRAAGVMKVQPGIESLDSEILKLMKKGITALQNIQTLKWLTEGGFDVSWFILTGFPGETLGQYEQMVKVLRRISHLIAPGNLAPVYIERFSPYQTRPEAFGIRLTGHSRWYDHAFPEIPQSLRSRIAYRFDYEDPQRDPQIDVFLQTRMKPLVEAWKADYRALGCTLHLLHAQGATVLALGPLARPERLILLPERYGRILRAADEIVARERLSSSPMPETEWDAMGARQISDQILQRYLSCFPDRVQDHRDRGRGKDAEDILGQLLASGLLLAEGDRVLALPVDAYAGQIASICDDAPARQPVMAGM